VLSITPWRCTLCVGGISPDGGRCLHCAGIGLTDDPVGPAVRAPRPPGVMPKPCGDCAYRPGSPEREAPGQTLPKDEPFFCHRGLPVTAAGAYVPVATFNGLPLGAMVCAGWWAVRTDEPLSERPFKEKPLTERDIEAAWGSTPAIYAPAVREIIRHEPDAAAVPRPRPPHGDPLLGSVTVLAEAGWRVHRLPRGERGDLVEAEHPDQGDIMLTRERGRGRRYYLHRPPHRHWLHVSAAVFWQFVHDRQMPTPAAPGVRLASVLCQHDATGYLTQNEARAALHVGAAASSRTGRRDNPVGRCPSDPRVWHLTLPASPGDAR
jgi:hypothetical protein